MKFADFKNRQPVDDIYFISRQLKEIDNNFCLVFNTKNNLYEVLDTGSGWVIASTRLYPDQRFYQKVLHQLSRDATALAEEIDLNNAALEKRQQSRLIERSASQLESIIAYAAKRPSIDVDPQTMRKIIM